MISAETSHGLRCMGHPCLECVVEMGLRDHRAILTFDDDGATVVMCKCGHVSLSPDPVEHVATEVAAAVRRVVTSPAPEGGQS